VKNIQLTDAIKMAIKVLKSGGTMLYPTDTVWGIGCDATNIKAIGKVMNIKKRDATKNFILLLSTIDQLERFVDVPDSAKDLIIDNDRMTVIYNNTKNLPSILLAKDGSIAIRIVKEAFCKELLDQFDKPIISTSANFTDELTPSNFTEIHEDIKDLVDHIVDYRQNDTATGEPSSIVRILDNGDIQFIRK